MDPSTKKDLKLSLFVGAVAGVLLFLILPNLGLHLSPAGKMLAFLGLAAFTPSGYLVAYWLSQWWPVMIQFVKFGITGGLNALIYLGTLNFLITNTKIAAGFYYSLFVAIAFIVAVVNSYFWNKYWVFRVRKDESRRGEFIGFFLVNLISFAINVGSASIVVNKIGAPAGFSPELWANIGAVSAVLISLFWNFLGTKFFVFKK